MNITAKLVLMVLIGPCLFGFQQQAAPPADFPIGAGDLLEIGVYGVSDFSREVRVSASGIIRLPFLGELKVEGLTPSQLEAKLTGLLHPNFVVDPQVSVMIKEPRSRMYSILGAVMKPGQYQMLENITLVRAIAVAGGLNLARVGDTALIQRSQATDAAQAASYQIEVNLKKLLHEGELSLDIPIMPADVISIPERETNAFFVIGDVTRPGPFEFPKEQGIKLSRALAMAGGPTKTSRLKDTALIRQRPDGSVDRRSLNLGKVLKGEDPDIDLQPNDMVYIPGSVEKSLGWTTLQNLPYMLTWLLLR